MITNNDYNTKNIYNRKIQNIITIKELFYIVLWKSRKKCMSIRRISAKILYKKLGFGINFRF